MSCPDWRTLARLRDASPAESNPEPAGWDAAVAHFESGCPRCRRAALAAEPVLVFRRLRTAGALEMSPAQEASEVDAVRQAVAAMRTASRAEVLESRARSGWKRWLAAAALIAAALSIPADNVRQDRREPGRTASMFRGAVLPAAYTGAAAPPTAEGGQPGARVYHMDGEGMSVVMIVDESIDV